MTDDPQHHLANGTITQREADALELQAGGMSTRAIALALGISRGAARDRLKNAHQKIADHERSAA